MKILYVLNSSKYGGMEWHVYDLVKGMVKNGHEVFVWCPEGAMSDLYAESGAETYDKKIAKDIDFKYINELAVFIKKNCIDIVHAHELKAASNALLAGNKAKVKVLITHTHTPISEWKIPEFKKKINKKVYSFLVNKYSDSEIALTESKKRVKIKEGIKESKLTVIPNGLDTLKFHITPNQRSEYEEEIKNKYGIPKTAFVFGNVGRLTEEKGIDILIKAFSKFLKSDLFHQRDFYLLIAGGGKLEESLKKLAQDLNLDGKVIITGAFDDIDKVKYYSSFDAFVFSSLAEGFGIVLLEALYMGLPTVCSDLEVLKEVGGDSVRYFESGDDNSLAKAMIDEYEITSKDGKSALDKSRLRVESLYSMEKFISNYLNLYKKLLEKNQNKERKGK
ncbi:MAG: glycosyltransferase family 4 protein [Patescibacteria group bacterium]